MLFDSRHREKRSDLYDHEKELEQLHRLTLSGY